MSPGHQKSSRVVSDTNPSTTSILLLRAVILSPQGLGITTTTITIFERKTMTATSQYMARLLGARRVPARVSRYADAASAQRFSANRMHDLGLEPRKVEQPLPAWAEAFGAQLQRYWGGGIEAEHVPSVG